MATASIGGNGGMEHQSEVVGIAPFHAPYAPPDEDFARRYLSAPQNAAASAES